jgi:hypothetical protein
MTTSDYFFIAVSTLPVIISIIAYAMSVIDDLNHNHN